MLWCYLIWYLVMAAAHFDPSPPLWGTAAGISAIMGVAIYLSFPPPGQRADRWHVMRVFLMPFCVASFSALVKGKGFLIVFSPNLVEDTLALGLCGAFLVACLLARRHARNPPPATPPGLQP